MAAVARIKMQDEQGDGYTKSISKFREALGRTKGFSNICRMGHRLMPAPVCNRGIYELPSDYLQNTSRIGDVPEAWQQPYSICANRWHNGVLRKGFSLNEIRKNRMRQVLPIGRAWNGYYPAKFNVDRGEEWGSKFLKLEPVFSGLGNETIEKTALAALSALPYAFAGARASDFSDDARHAVHGLTRRPYNAVRLLTRLAVMWLGAVLCEQESRRLTLAGYDQAPQVRYIRSSGDMSIGLTDAVDARAQTLYVEMSRIGRDPTILEVYFAALVSKPQWRTVMSAERVPSILGLWPEIPHAQLSIYGRDEAILHVENLSASTIWMAIEVFVQQMALRDVWDEVLQSVATFALRPEGDTVMCGHNIVKVSLPESCMGPAALGPIMENARHWEDEAMPVVQPTIPELMWRSAQRYSIWSLLYRDLCAQCGGNEGYVFAPDAQQAKRIEWCLYAGTTVVAGNKICEKAAEDYGWKDLLGRILRTVAGGTKTSLPNTPPMYANTAIAHEYALQWEEVAPYSTKMPEGSAALSLIYPARAQGVPMANEWTTPLNVVNRYGLSDAMYTMGTKPGCRLGYTIYSPTTQKYRVIGTSMRMNYRGAPADCNFFACRDWDGTLVEPVFKFSAVQDAMNGFQMAAYNYDSEWYVEHEIDQSFDGILAHFRDLDKALGPPPGGEQLLNGRQIQIKTVGGQDGSQPPSPKDKEVVDDAERPESPTQPVFEAKAVEGLKRAREIPDSLKFLNVQREIITRVMEEEPLWVQYIAEIKNLRGNPLEQKDEIARLAQLVMQRLRDFDPTLLPHAATDQTRIPQLMRACGYMLKEFAAFVTGHDSTQLMLRMSEGCRCVARSFELGEGIFDSISYSNVHNRQLPRHVSDADFNKGLRVGVTIGDLVFSRDSEHLAKLIGEAEAAYEEKIAKEAEADAEYAYMPPADEVQKIKDEYDWVNVQGMPQPQPQKAPDDPGPSGQAKEAQPLSEVEVESIPIMETRDEKTHMEEIPPSVTEAPFGGVPPQQAVGGEDQQQIGAVASDVERPQGAPAILSFETRTPQEE